MMSGRELLGVGLPLLGRVALDERLVERAADQADPLLLEVLRLGGVDLAGLLGDQLARLVRGVALAEELVDQAEVHREGVDLPLVLREDAVLVAGEVGEPVDVLPDLVVGGVEQVGAVDVHLDAGLGLGLAVGVAAEVVATLEHQHLEVELSGAAFCDRQAEESGADDDEVRVQHTLLGRGDSQSTDGVAASRARHGWDVAHATRRENGTDHVARLGDSPAEGGDSTTTASAIRYGLSRTSRFSPYRKWTAKRFRYM